MNQLLRDEMELDKRMEVCVGKDCLTKEEIDAVCTDLTYLSYILKKAFGLNLIVSDKTPLVPVKG